LALVATALGSDGWAAAVGLEELGLVAAGELGVPLSRLLLVQSPGSAHRATAVASLIEAVDLILLGGGPGLAFTAREARRLSARAREQDAVLVHFDGGRNWPQGLDATLTVEPIFAGRASGTGGAWSGIDGSGHGYLRSRPVTVSATGRRSMAQSRQVEVVLPGADGRLGTVSASGATTSTTSTPVSASAPSAASGPPTLSRLAG
jgi:hypothetical protein